MSDNQVAEYSTDEPIFSRALKSDGALTWDLPLSIGEGSLPEEEERFQQMSQCFQECLEEESAEHFCFLATQLLEGVGVQNVKVWVSVLVRISEQLTGMMSSKKFNERRLLLSRDALKIELLPEIGTPAESCVIPGVVLRRNIAHRRMRMHIHHPRLLLLSGALEFECNKLTQLHTVINKEPEFVDAAVDKILAVSPDVCVVERKASRYAIERLQKANVTLVCDIPMADMTNLAINTNTKIVENILDVDDSCIGTCSQFYILRVKPPKTQNTSNGRLPSPLMVFEVNSDQAASAVVLRGGSDSDLALVKKALTFAVFAAYRLHFENAFLRDTLSDATVATAAFGVEGLSEINGLESLRQVCRDIVQQSTRRAGLKRQCSDCVDSVSPHVTNWTATRSHAAFKQRTEFKQPLYDPGDAANAGHGDGLGHKEPSVSALSTCSSSSVVTTQLASASKGEKALETGYASMKTGIGAQCLAKPPPSPEVSRESNKACAEAEGLTIGTDRSQSARVVEQDTSKAEELSDTERRDLKGGKKDVKSTPPEDMAELILHRSSWDSISLTNAQGQGSYPNAWDNWSDVEKLRGSKGFLDVHDEQLDENVLLPARASKKLRVMENMRFSASFANRNHRLGLLCEPCHVRSIDSLSDNDLSLMEFLMSIAADAPKRCPAGCGGGNSSHHRTFLHGAVRLTISVVSLPIDRSYANPKTDIWFWARPKGVSATPMNTVSQILLSEDAKCLSLGQFLQLMCNTPELKVFGRLLYLEHVIYFGYGRTVACIYGDRIRLKPVYTPSPIIHYSLATQINWLTTAADQLIQEVNFVYEAIQRSCVPSLTPSADRETNKTAEQLADEYFVRSGLIPSLVEEKEKFCEEVRGFSNGIMAERTTTDQVLEKYLQLNQMWRQLSINVLAWSSTMNDPDTAADLSMDPPFEDISLSIGTRISDTLVVEAPGGEFLLGTMTWKSKQRFSSDLELQSNRESISLKEEAPQSRNDNHSSPPDSWHSDNLATTGQDDHCDDMLRRETPFLALVDQPFPPSPFDDPDDEPDWVKDDTPKANNNGLRLRVSPPCIVDLVRSPSITPVLSDGEAHLKLKQNSSTGNLLALMDREARQFHEACEQEFVECRQRSISLPASPRENKLLNQLERRLNFVLDDEDFGSCSDSGEGYDDFPTPSTIQPLAMRGPPQLMRSFTPASRTPLPGTEIRLSCRAMIPLGNDDLVIPVFEAEPASIIAYVLSSIGYHKELQHSFDCLNSHPSNIKSRTADSSGDLDYTASDSGSGRASNMTEPRGVRTKSMGPMHITQRFEDSPPGMISSDAKFEVISYFAPQFTKMRSRCINGGERSFVMSMSRSRRWKASGGKSNAYFAKTLDDRYIIKSLSKAEKTSFLEKIGPCYFTYMENQHFKRQDVALAKILGLFQVSMKSFPSRSARTERVENGCDASDLGREWVMDLVIVENVFYDRQCSSIYDLKGSHRCRYNKEAEKAGDARGVFLDTNLKKHNLLAPPLLVDQSSFNNLAEILRRDTDFLVSNSIMDYSLLVGVDSETNCLVVGIIDYIRQYTWDKRLESWVKSSGIMGDGNEEPTIISPESYRKRFQSTILGYFTVVPYL